MFIVKYKRNMFLFGLCILLFIGIVIVYFIGNQDRRINKRLNLVGSDFYENFYYPQLVEDLSDEDIESNFSKYENQGIKVDLDSLLKFNASKYDNLKEEIRNSKTGQYCDLKKTKVIIYPKSPYELQDYRLDTEIDCGY